MEFTLLTNAEAQYVDVHSKTSRRANLRRLECERRVLGVHSSLLTCGRLSAGIWLVVPQRDEDLRVAGRASHTTTPLTPPLHPHHQDATQCRVFCGPRQLSCSHAHLQQTVIHELWNSSCGSRKHDVICCHLCMVLLHPPHFGTELQSARAPVETQPVFRGGGRLVPLHARVRYEMWEAAQDSWSVRRTFKWTKQICIVTEHRSNDWCNGETQQ